jgi:hypothetical protein
LAIGVALCSAGSAHAQNKVEADFKGAVGLGLIGAELGAVIPALVGVDATWAYIVFPVVGAAGGAVAGYFAIDNPGHVELSVAALVLGMTLVLPALVVTLSQTAYDPGSDSDESATASKPRQGQAASAAARSIAARRRAQQARLQRGPGLVQLGHGELAVSAPGFTLIPSAERGELRLAGVSVSLLSGRF